MSAEFVTAFVFFTLDVGFTLVGRCGVDDCVPFDAFELTDVIFDDATLSAFPFVVAVSLSG